MTSELNRELLDIILARRSGDGIPVTVDFHAQRPRPIPPPPPPPVSDQPIHEYFGLSYASYLVLPRSVLQSMPQLWQACFVGLLKELDAAWDGPPENTCYDVTLLEGSTSNPDYQIADDLADYERGRRQVPLKTLEGTEFVVVRDEYLRAVAAKQAADRRAAEAEFKVQAITVRLTAPLEKLLREREA